MILDGAKVRRCRQKKSSYWLYGNSGYFPWVVYESFSLVTDPWLGRGTVAQVNSFFYQNQENFFVSALLQTYHAMMYYNVCWVRTATRGAPCNKSAMTDNSYPSHKMGAKPVHGIQSLFSWHPISIRMASNQCFHGVEAVGL